MDHRAKNLLALVQATVQLTHADTVEDFKAAIEGRLQALSNAHTLLAQSRWAGANLHTLVTEELAPYHLEGMSRANINGPELVLEAKIGTDDCDGSARVDDERGQVRGSVGSFGPASSRVVAWRDAACDPLV